MNSPFLGGKRLDLRGTTREDLSFILHWLNDPEVTKFMIMGERPTHLEVLDEQWQKEIRDTKTIPMTIVDKKTARPVGWCGFYGIRAVTHAAEYRIFIGEKTKWNKGFATEATRLMVQYGFEKLNFHKIFLGVNADYLAAVKTYEKAGFVKEGVLRDEIFRNNRFYDALRMSILRREYRRK